MFQIFAISCRSSEEIELEFCDLCLYNWVLLILVYIEIFLKKQTQKLYSRADNLSNYYITRFQHYGTKCDKTQIFSPVLFKDPTLKKNWLNHFMKSNSFFASGYLVFREIVNFSNTIYFRQHKWITKLLLTTQQSKVYYSSRREGVRVRKCLFCVAGLYVGPWFAGSVFKTSSERRVPSGISGGHVRETCFFC